MPFKSTNILINFHWHFSLCLTQIIGKQFDRNGLKMNLSHSFSVGTCPLHCLYLFGAGYWSKTNKTQIYKACEVKRLHPVLSKSNAAGLTHQQKMRVEIILQFWIFNNFIFFFGKFDEISALEWRKIKCHERTAVKGLHVHFTSRHTARTVRTWKYVVCIGHLCFAFMKTFSWGHVC